MPYVLYEITRLSAILSKRGILINYKNIEIDSDQWGAMFAGGSQEIDTRVSVNKREEILHLSAINRNHRVLLEV